MFNSELWTVTGKIEEKIDVFQRSLLRKLMGVRWPKKLSNIQLYEVTKCEKWSMKIKRRRFKWLGHLLRLLDETPAKCALCEFLRPARKPKGRPPNTWVGNIEKELREFGYTLRQAEELARDRDKWRCVVNRVKSAELRQ